jgi:hypothetical protein
MKMADTLRRSADLEAVEPSISGVSWAAVSAAVAASLAITLVLLSFGAGMGFAVVSPWGGSGVSGTTFKIGTGLFFIVMAMLSSSIGGYLAGRLRTKCRFRGGANGRVQTLLRPYAETGDSQSLSNAAAALKGETVDAMEGGGLRDGTWKKKAYGDTAQSALNRN